MTVLMPPSGQTEAAKMQSRKARPLSPAAQTLCPARPGPSRLLRRACTPCLHDGGADEEPCHDAIQSRAKIPTAGVRAFPRLST